MTPTAAYVLILLNINYVGPGVIKQIATAEFATKEACEAAGDHVKYIAYHKEIGRISRVRSHLMALCYPKYMKPGSYRVLPMNTFPLKKNRR